MADFYEKLARDEYEIQLYGFSLEEFVDSNFDFVNKKVKHASEYLKRNFVELVSKQKNPQLGEKVLVMFDAGVARVKKDIKKNIDQVNEAIKSNLAIPDNVLLLLDCKHMDKQLTEERRLQLIQECEELEKTVKENAFFIHALSDEISIHEECIEDVLDQEEIAFDNIDMMLNTPLETVALADALSTLSNL